MDQRRLGFIGAGNMAEAICRGVLQSRLFAREGILAADIMEARRQVFAEELKVRVTERASEVAACCDVVVLAVKPQQMARALEAFGGRMRADQMAISIMAGVPTSKIELACGEGARVVRVMPNTPMLVGKGMSAVCGGRYARPEDVETALRICREMGEAVETAEGLMDAVTAVSGSGPAYFFFLVEKMIEAGVAEGLPEETAALLARQTALGAAELMRESYDPPGELRRKVTSPGGTTEAAFRVIFERGADKAWVDAIRQAAARSRELGR